MATIHALSARDSRLDLVHDNPPTPIEIDPRSKSIPLDGDSLDPMPRLLNLPVPLTGV